MNIVTKRVYEAPDAGDGYRVLIDRLWPRGVSKERLLFDEWLKDIAPSAELRQWFAHDESKWKEFCKRYFAELDENPVHVEKLIGVKKSTLTLLYGARNEKFNNAVALKRYIENRQKS